MLQKCRVCWGSPRHLTLPSSGRAFGTPLKSNVRRLWSRRARSSRKVRAIALSQSHLPHKARAWSVSIANAFSRLGAHGKRSERFAPTRSRASITKFWSFRAPTFEHFRRLPIPQRLKPQSGMLERSCLSPFASAALSICRSLEMQGLRISKHAASSEQDQVGSYQPPNPSFKRTCLRQAA